MAKESKDEDVVLWKCLLCKFYMHLDKVKCINTKCYQQRKDGLVVKVKIEELFLDKNGNLVSIKDLNEQE